MATAGCGLPAGGSHGRCSLPLGWHGVQGTGPQGAKSSARTAAAAAEGYLRGGAAPAGRWQRAASWRAAAPFEADELAGWRGLPSGAGLGPLSAGGLGRQGSAAARKPGRPGAADGRHPAVGRLVKRRRDGKCGRKRWLEWGGFRYAHTGFAAGQDGATWRGRVQAARRCGRRIGGHADGRGRDGRRRSKHTHRTKPRAASHGGQGRDVAGRGASRGGARARGRGGCGRPATRRAVARGPPAVTRRRPPWPAAS
jgi:hypothetical protein